MPASDPGSLQCAPKQLVFLAPRRVDFSHFFALLNPHLDPPFYFSAPRTSGTRFAPRFWAPPPPGVDRARCGRFAPSARRLLLQKASLCQNQVSKTFWKKLFRERCAPGARLPGARVFVLCNFLDFGFPQPALKCGSTQPPYIEGGGDKLQKVQDVAA